MTVRIKNYKKVIAFWGGNYGAKVLSSAFTLIELLVVIAIIGVLAALLLPTLNKSLEQGRSMACINNLKALQFSWHLYADENEGKLPLNNYVISVRPGNEELTKGQSWAPGDARYDTTTENLEKGLLFPYLRNASVFKCPSDFSSAITPSGEKLGKPRVRSVNMNMWLACDKNIESTTGRKLSIYTLNGITTPKPNQFFVFIDTHPDTISDPTFGIYAPGDPRGEYWANLPSDRHNKGANISFADGHVEHWKWRAPKKVTTMTQFGQPPNGLDDRKDLRKLQTCIPPAGWTP